MRCAAKVHPELLECSPRILIDNSTHPDAAYDELCARWSFEHARYHNVGIAGARMEAARYVIHAGLGGRLMFEDDMLFHDRQPRALDAAISQHPDGHSHRAERRSDGVASAQR